MEPFQEQVGAVAGESKAGRGCATLRRRQGEWRLKKWEQNIGVQIEPALTDSE